MLDKLISLYAPHECLSCHVEGWLLCTACRRQLALPAPRCYSCHRLSPANRTCEVCRRTSKLFAVHAAADYDGVAKELIARLKFGGARAAADEWDEEDAQLPGQLAVDVYETREKLVVKARTAGVNKGDLDVSISDNQLTIRGTLSAGTDDEVENYFLQECYWGEFSRTIALPVPVKEEEIEAMLKDGVLTISFGKVQQDTVKKIQVL
jgi:HSP20 family protein